MKRVMGYFLAMLVIIAAMSLIGCKKNSPSATVVSTNTPDYEKTVQAGIVNTQTAISAVGTATATITLTQTGSNAYSATVTSTQTQTSTPTSVPTPVGGAETLVFVPGGTYTQTNTNSHSFIHTISAFYIGKYEVTYDLWYNVYHWAITNGYTFANAGMEGCCGVSGAEPTSAKYQPVTTINWRDMIVWCNAYSEKSGLTFVYYSDAGFTTPIKDSTSGTYGSSVNINAGSSDNPYANWSVSGYRLPTDGEWQYTASYIDGLSWTPYNYASGATADTSNSTATQLVGWNWNNSGNVMHNVGLKTANALTIYDMAGNALEWCWDWSWQGTWIDPGTTTDYRGPDPGAASSARKVLHGGAFSMSPDSMRVGFVSGGSSYASWKSVGFRIAKK